MWGPSLPPLPQEGPFSAFTNAGVANALAEGRWLADIFPAPFASVFFSSLLVPEMWLLGVTHLSGAPWGPTLGFISISVAVSKKLKWP